MSLTLFSCEEESLFFEVILIVIHVGYWRMVFNAFFMRFYYDKNIMIYYNNFIGEWYWKTREIMENMQKKSKLKGKTQTLWNKCIFKIIKPTNSKIWGIKLIWNNLGFK